MELSAPDVANVLAKKGVKYLVHANTVRTASGFLAKGQLLGRGKMDQSGLPQTAQASDELDVRYGIYHDVFLDTDDVHYRSREPNLYGPVSFVIDLDILRSGLVPYVWITRTNPIYWDGHQPNERYFADIEQVDRELQKGDYGSHVMIRCLGGFLPLEGYLRWVALDDPHRPDYPDLFTSALEALHAALEQSRCIDPARVRQRRCREGCTCVQRYEELSEYDIEHRFFP